MGEENRPRAGLRPGRGPASHPPRSGDDYRIPPANNQRKTRPSESRPRGRPRGASPTSSVASPFVVPTSVGQRPAFQNSTQPTTTRRSRYFRPHSIRIRAIRVIRVKFSSEFFSRHRPHGFHGFARKENVCVVSRESAPGNALWRFAHLQRGVCVRCSNFSWPTPPTPRLASRRILKASGAAAEIPCLSAPGGITLRSRRVSASGSSPN